jgi:hypothetical protein
MPSSGVQGYMAVKVADALDQILAKLPRAEHHQVCVERPTGEVLCAQLYAGRGWLMYLLYPGDAGFSSRNPAYDGPPDAMYDFILPYGQGDEYPANFWLPYHLVYRALLYFYVHGGLAPWITWHDDTTQKAWGFVRRAALTPSLAQALKRS